MFWYVIIVRVCVNAHCCKCILSLAVRSKTVVIQLQRQMHATASQLLRSLARLNSIGPLAPSPSHTHTLRNSTTAL